MDEFELIARYFSAKESKPRKDVLLGIGDDCALLDLPHGKQLLVSMDTLVSGVHFPETTMPYDIGYKALAVNLSDLAAMGASPAWITLALTMPELNEQWLSDFSRGLFSLCSQFDVALVGGDTTRGPLSITIQAHGFIPKGQAVKRSGARNGDLIYVTGPLGDAGLALKHLIGELQLPNDYLHSVMTRLNRPFPRIKEGLLLRNHATAMIDVSDGLVADLGHVLEQSKVGASIDLQKIPLSEFVKKSLHREAALQLALCAGDDYELCFTVSPEHKNELESLMNAEGCAVFCIGRINNARQFVLKDKDRLLDPKLFLGYSHF
ncbi:thiamine-phosphate kinase [Legionella waltersii]|uniref:Thiamine-monophosphate kinase n=1 Tax=Legionella waltersii TaxID=66969 RepID=A0A0W1AMP4_9GAMM|nr:thiamine-phosphate kinase [Legionella waltersii]KTD82601.1 Thiamine-monophosphate kinase [Legionella waltersii]SNV02679.1 Thiamine-monophosphate kinase [Legionella waltersii]